MDSNYTDYKILKTIEQNSDISQRSISSATGINVSSVNYALKQLVQKGYVKITNMNKKRIIYHLTTSGIKQKGKLAYSVFLRNYNLFSEIGEIVSNILKRPEIRGKRVAIFGLNELAEIIYISLKKSEAIYCGIFEDNPKKVGKKWVEGDVQSLDSLTAESDVDYILDVKSAAKDILKLNFLTPEMFISQKKKVVKKGNMKSEIEIFPGKSGLTGICALLTASGKKILIDCGLFLDGDEELNNNNDSFPFDPKEIDYLMLTNAHIYHSGRIPRLIDRGFEGEILCHHTTLGVLPLYIEQAFGYEGLTNYKKSTEEIKEKIIEQSWGFEYSRWHQISNGIRFKMFDSGFMPGSASIKFDIEGEYVVFSGDIGTDGFRAVKKNQLPERADILVLESTFGGRNHKKDVEKDLFREIIKRAQEANGKVLIPAFSSGRIQDIIWQINEWIKRQDISDIRIVIDSSLVTRVKEFLKKYKESQVSESFSGAASEGDFDYLCNLMERGFFKNSCDWAELNCPAVVFVWDGIFSGGTIQPSLKKLLGKESTEVILPGHTVPFSPESNLFKNCEDGTSNINVKGRNPDVKAKVHELSSFSMHADHEGLIEWVRGISGKPHTIFLNHGDSFSQSELRKSLQEKFDTGTIISSLE